MEKISEMINRMCPDGVERVRLDSVCSFTRGKTITAKSAIEGSIPVISGGQTPSYYHNEANRVEDTVVIAGSGAYAGFVSYWQIPIYVSDAFSVDPNEELQKKYLFYFLKQNQQNIYETQKGAGVPHVHGKDIAGFEIPLPPLPIQQEIVRILDSFTSMITNLETELASRQKQYEYYRNKLFTFQEGEFEWKTLGEIADTISGFPFKSNEFTKSGIKLMRGMNVKRGYFDFNEEDDRYWATSKGLENYLLNNNDIVISMDGSLVGRSFAKLTKKHLPLLLVQRVARIRSNNNNYLYQCIKMFFSDYVDKKKTAGAIPHVSTKDINSFPIPIPSLQRQQEIVSTLDTFESLISNIKQELDARKKQYEYYREKLLTFE